MAYMPSKPIMAKYEAAQEALEKAGATGCPAKS